MTLALSDRGERFRLSQPARKDVYKRFAFVSQAHEYSGLFATLMCRDLRTCQIQALDGVHQD